MTEEDLKNLRIIFTLARKQVVEDKKQLIQVIAFEDELFKKLKDGEDDK